MARFDLVDTYLAALAERIRWRSDLEDVLAEAEDHLYTTVERLTASGSTVVAAQMRALHRFGEPNLVATAFARTSRGGLAMPTRSTHAGGTLAIVSAVLWLVVVAAWWLAGAAGMAAVDPEPTTPYIVYGVGAAALLAAGATMIASMLSLDQSHGGLGMLGRGGLIITGVGALASLAAWVFMAWGIAMAAGTATFAAAMLGREVAPRPAALAFGTGPALGAVTWAVLRVLQGSPLDYTGLWGDDRRVNLVAVTVGAVVLSLGLLGLGRWLRSERPVFVDGSGGAMTA